MAHHPRVGRLDNVIGYVYSRPAQSEREHELKAITLRFLAMAKREVPSLDVGAQVSCPRGVRHMPRGEVT